jgi:predicted O-methyltransferase YrrM
MDDAGKPPKPAEVSALRVQKLRHVMRNAGYFSGKELTSDWTTHNIALWAQLLAPYRDQSIKILEIGSYEGRSALFFLNYLPHSTIVCVDRFDESREDAERAVRMAKVESRFDENLAPFASRCEKRKGLSAAVLPKLALEGYRFNIVYVDGDHCATSVYQDAALSWPLLEADGIMIFDDYQWRPERASEDRPQPGIDSFLGSMQGRYREMYHGYQMVVKKI